MKNIPIRAFNTAVYPDKSLQGKYCLSPFVMIEVTLTGDVRLCGCGSWHPTTVGNLLENNLQHILSSDRARTVRQSIIDGTYRFCNENQCGIIANNELNSIDTVPDEVKTLLLDASAYQMPNWISIQGDDVCNLSCPSCRTQIKKSKASEIQSRKKIGKIIYNNLFSQPTDKTITVHVSGSGEIFASPLLLEMISSIDLGKLPNIQLCLQSNGLLAPKNWHNIQHLESAINHVVISIDAATASTYEIVRRGGSWPQLIQAMSFLQEKKQQLGFELRTRMVVQDRNANEVTEFYNFCRGFGVDRIEYSKISNWGTWTRQQFDLQNVFDPRHPKHQAVIQDLNQLKTQPGVWLHGLI